MLDDLSVGAKVQQPMTLYQDSTLYSVYRSEAQRFLERGSTGAIVEELNDLLFGQGSTTKDTGARLYSACRRRARRPLERSSAGVIRAVLNDPLAGARPDNQGAILEQDLLVSAREELYGP